MQPTYHLPLPRQARLDVPPERLAIALGCPDYDVLLVGDGSGTGGWTIAGGWACCVLERATRHRELVYGGWNRCSILVAELMAYFQALTCFEATRAADLRRRLGRGLKILVITDNAHTVSHSEFGLLGGKVPNETVALWAGLRALASQTGSEIVFKFAPRLSTQLNFVADQIAGRTRRTVGRPALGEMHIRGHQNPTELRFVNPDQFVIAPAARAD